MHTSSGDLQWYRCGVIVKPDNSNSHEFELHRPSNKGTKLHLKVIKAIIIIGQESDSDVRLPLLVRLEKSLIQIDRGFPLVCEN